MALPFIVWLFLFRPLPNKTGDREKGKDCYYEFIFHLSTLASTPPGVLPLTFPFYPFTPFG